MSRPLIMCIRSGMMSQIMSKRCKALRGHHSFTPVVFKIISVTNVYTVCTCIMKCVRYVHGVHLRLVGGPLLRRRTLVASSQECCMLRVRAGARDHELQEAPSPPGGASLSAVVKDYRLSDHNDASGTPRVLSGKTRSEPCTSDKETDHLLHGRTH